jgi:beta-lactamase regulating signal transducer with metallopeptidase domain
MAAVPEILRAIAQASVEQMAYCLAAGTLIALLAWAILRWMPRQDARGRFILWFYSLIAIASLPFLAGAWKLTATHSQSGPMTDRSLITMPQSWALYIFVAWAAFVGLALVRMAIALWQVQRLRRACVEVDLDSLDPALKKTLQESATIRGARLCVSDRIAVPAAIGFIKPVIVVPSWLLQELTPTELHQVVMHELAHLQRRDDWTNLAQKTLKAVLCFHPAAWWIESQLSLEREMACDEAVLAANASPNAYAHCLVSMAEKSFGRRAAALTQAAVNRTRQTSLRVAHILHFDAPRKCSAWTLAATASVLFALVVAVSAVHAPTLIGFRDDVSGHTGSGQAQLVAHSGTVVPALASASSPSLSGQEKIGLIKAKLPLATAIRPLHFVRPEHGQPLRPAMMHDRRRQSPATLRLATSRSSGEANENPGMQTFVVMQEQQFGPAGAQVWLVQVWQVVLTVDQSSAQTISRKSI